MNRSLCIKDIMNQVNDDDIVIASTGYIAREVYRQKDRDLNFYMQGSMGNAFAIGIGLAMHVKNRVFVISGDGAVLMGLGSLITAKSLALHNLIHFILDNNCHESTGGQKTNSHLLDFRHLCKNTIVYKIGLDKDIPPRIKLSCKQITERFKNAVQRLSDKQK